ncbi:pyrimidine-specific ribonucleoside hydrolase [Trypanosoma theileri]|uniref:Pyrimidine-specific ribonucleoside hydrolase n=1 Tax=Trypanosoma theileri TaxID=67003 RepID=A0A1X0NSH6_9TRYP|nr:pyrimidine-specific ribonucleoside hydrolase [Trypanosoma theileri]ORC87656.1 pyrimidine-specific ribonucleoside hydrolase [Trypanosoma theileri]
MDRVHALQSQWVNLPQPRKMKALRIIAAVCYAIALFFLVIFTFGGTTTASRTPEAAVIFTEATPGGIAALRYLSLRRDVNIAAVVIAINAWNVNVNAAHDNIRAFLAAMREEKTLHYDVPVYYGNSLAQVNAHFLDDIAYTTDTNPSTGERNMNTTSCTYRRVLSPDILMDADRLFGGAELLDTVQISAPTSSSSKDSKNKNSKISQLEFFEEPLSSYLVQNTATFLVLGPATDAAWFLQRHSEHRNHVNSIFFAAGALTSDTDLRFVYPPNRRAEQHAFFDPHAANYIVSGAHRIPVEMLPLDATPQWPKDLYDSYVTSRASLSSTSSSKVPVSAQVVARAIEGYSRRLRTDVPLPVAVTAAAYFADIHVRDKATVAEIPILVANGVSMATDGTVGTPSKTQQHSEVFKVKVIMHLQEATFWKRFEAVDNLGK